MKSVCRPRLSDVETYNHCIAAEVEVRLANWFKKIAPTVAAHCKDLALIARKAHNLNVVVRSEQENHDHCHSYARIASTGKVGLESLKTDTWTITQPVMSSTSLVREHSSEIALPGVGRYSPDPVRIRSNTDEESIGY